MCEPWAEPYWDSVMYQKHMAMSKRDWERSIARTSTVEPGSASQYDPNITSHELEGIEMSILQPGNLIRQSGHVRTYWRNMGRTIGASCGELTDYIFVRWHCMGSVHGYPITRGELINKKGVSFS